jgi:lipid-A-disaccharide synthase-like uncharacterized protein
MTTEQMWIAIGVAGQACFGMRIVLQWMASERHKRSVVPLSFWLFSVAGGFILLAYAIYRSDPVFIIAEGMTLLIYARNLYFLRRARAAAAIDTRGRRLC